MTRISLLISACLFLAQNANAAQAGSEVKNVVLVSMSNCCSTNAWPEAEKAAIEEFQTINLNVMIVDGEATNARKWTDELETITRQSNADCAIRIYKSSNGKKNGVDLWIRDKESGEVTFSHIPLGRKTDSEAVAIATLRSLEAIRAGLLSQQIVPALSNSETPADSNTLPAEESDTTNTKTVPSEQDHRSGQFGAGVGLGAAGSPGDTGVHGAVDITLEWNPIPKLSLEIDGAIKVFGSRIESQSHASSFNFAAVRLFGHYEFLQTGRLRPAAGIGGGVVFAWTEGDGSESLAAQRDRTQVGYLGVAGRLGLVLTDRLWLVLGTRVGLTFPDVKIYFSDDEAASFGRPLIEGFLNLKVRFP